MKSRDVYQKLGDHLTKVGQGYPKVDALLELLHSNLSPQEAKVALGLPIKLPPLEVEEIDVIARQVKMDPDEVQEILEGLAQRGFVYRGISKNGNPGYAMIQPGYGFPQVFFWKGEKTPYAENMAKLLLPILRDEKSVKKLGGTPKTKTFRFIPIQKAIPYSLQVVLPYEEMVEIINKVSIIALAHCPCRMMASLSGERECPHTLETCLKFNAMARFIIDRGLARQISKDEALEVLKKTEEEGLVHFVDNCQRDVQHNCNCCSCCCWSLRAIKDRKVPRDAIMATYFLRTTDTDVCEGCGTCVDSCPLGVITMRDDYPVVDENMCIGCGVCIPSCPSEAAKLKRKEEGLVPPFNFKDLHRKLLKETWNF